MFGLYERVREDEARLRRMLCARELQLPPCDTFPPVLHHTVYGRVGGGGTSVDRGRLMALTRKRLGESVGVLKQQSPHLGSALGGEARLDAGEAERPRG